MNLFSSMMSTQTEQFWTVYGLTMMVSVIISLAISLFVVVCRWRLRLFRTIVCTLSARLQERKSAFG